MPSRRIHFTSRRRITTNDVSISVDSDATPPTFTFDRLSLGRYSFPSDALVRVEAYRPATATYMRFDLGTIADLGAQSNLVLTEFDLPEGIRFRLKVTAVAETTQGQLLGECSSIRPDWANGGQESLLTVRPADLQHEVFRLDLDDEPILLVNEKISQWRMVARDDYFMTLVYPDVLRRILTRILLYDDPHDAEDSNDWQSLWIRSARSQPGLSDLPQEDESDPTAISEWIDEAVAAFCANHKIYDIFDKRLGSENDP